MEFEWDSRKAIENFRKHQVQFEEAATVLGDDLSVTVPDPDHSYSEFRFITVGMSNENRLLIVSYVERGEKFRIISARGLTRKERSIYEKARQKYK